MDKLYTANCESILKRAYKDGIKDGRLAERRKWITVFDKMADTHDTSTQTILHGIAELMEKNLTKTKGVQL